MWQESGGGEGAGEGCGVNTLTSELSATITSSTILVSVTTSRLSCGQEGRCVRQILLRAMASG